MFKFSKYIIMSKDISILEITITYLKKNFTFSLGFILIWLGLIIERIIFPHYYGKMLEVISKISPLLIFKNCKNYIVIIISLTIVSQILFTLNDFIDSKEIPKIQTFFRNNVIDKIINTFKENYKEIEIGDVISKLLKFPNTIKDLYNQFKNYISSALIISIFTIIYLFFINQKIGLLALVVLFIYLICIVNIGKRCLSSSTQRDKLHNDLYEQISDTFNNLNTVYSFNNTSKEKNRIDTYTLTLDKKYTKSLICSINFKIFYSIFYILIFILVNGYSFYLTYRKEIKVGQLVSILFVITYLLGDLQVCAGEIKDFLYNIGILKLNESYLNQLLTDKSGENKNSRFIFNNGNIKFINVDFSYNNKDFILKKFNLDIKSKQTVLIMGNIGSGKSTISKLILKFYTPQSGKIMIDNFDIANLSSGMVRQKIAYIPQNTKLFNRTIFENITYGNVISKNEIIVLMRKYDLSNIFTDLNNLLEKIAGKSGENLSGGQRQIICFLRVLINIDMYSIVIFDEPTSALDQTTKNIVINIMKVISKKKTTIIICHDKELLNLADRYIYIQKGVIQVDQITNNL